MSDDQKLIKKIISSKITLFILLLGFIWLSVQLVNVFYRKHKLNKELEDLKAQVLSSAKSNQQISAILDYLGSKEFLEKQAREKLNMKKEGEEVVIVEPPKDLVTSTPEVSVSTESPVDVAKDQPEEKPKDDSNYKKWWNYFFK